MVLSSRNKGLQPTAFAAQCSSKSAGMLKAHIRPIITVASSVLISSCVMIYSGVIKNNYAGPVTIGSERGVRGDINIEPSNTTEVPIFETELGTCMSVTYQGETKFYHVPAPPKWSRISGEWDVKFGLSVSPSGAYYVGKRGEAMQLTEVPNCDT